MFLVGVVAILAVTVGKDWWTLDPNARFRRDLAQLRSYLDKGVADSPEALTIARRVQESIDSHPETNGSTRYVLGSTLLAQADAKFDEGADELYKAARVHLEKAESEGVPDADRLRLAYRLGRVWEQEDAVDPQKVIDYLIKSLQSSEDLSEGYRRLGEAYLRLPKPDLKKARDSIQQQLARALPRADPRILAQARLILGDLHTRLNEHEEARKVLDRIASDAPSEVYVASRIALARSYQAENDFASAIKHLEQARDKSTTPAIRGTVLYHLGVCYAQSNRRAEASKAWGQALQGNGPEAQAAAFRLAESQLRDGDRSSASKSLDMAVARTKAGTPYANPLFPANEARSLFEELCQVYRRDGDYEGAMKVADLYGKITDQGHDREIAADIAEAWGTALTATAEADASKREQWLADAKAKYIQSARMYERLSQVRKVSGERGDMLRKAGQQYRRAGERDKALEMLNSIVLKIPDYPEDKLGEVYFEMGESYLASDDKENAKVMYNNSLRFAGNSQARSRLQIAKLFLKDSQPDQALALLEENLDPQLQSKNPETHQQSLFTLGEVLYTKRDYPKAEQRLIEALQFYPSSPNAVKGRFLLGRCYWFQAGAQAKELQKRQMELNGNVTEEQKLVINRQIQGHEKQYREYLSKSINPFEEVERALVPGHSQGKHTSLEKMLFRQASFAQAEALFFLGEYEAAAQRYATITTRYPMQVESLSAYSQVWSIYLNNLSEVEKSADALKKMRDAYVQMKDDAFDGSTPIHKREYWKKWFEQLDASQQ